MGLLYCSLITLFLLVASKGVSSATFTFTNRCDYTVWPGILANTGTPKLDSTGFELARGTSRSFIAPTGWSGRFWGRTSCTLTGSGLFSCLTADCGSGQVECSGLGASPPATLAEFTLGSGTQDFYDVSLVDGYNLPMVVESIGGSGACGSTGCVTDLNTQCPSELRVGNGDACKSACEAFGSAEYCCSGAFSTPDTRGGAIPRPDPPLPDTCKPSVYSEMFKSACPRSYSYAYDDATSTFTCTGADYSITFCPSSPSQKSSRDVTPPATLGTPTDPSGYVSDSGSGSGSISTTGSGTTETGSSLGYGLTGSGSGSVPDASVVEDGSWLAGLAMGDSSTTSSPRTMLQSALISFTTFSVIVSFIHL